MNPELKIALILLADAISELASANLIHIGMDNASSIIGKAQAAIQLINKLPLDVTNQTTP